MEFDEKELRKEISYAIKNIHGIRHVRPPSLLSSSFLLFLSTSPPSVSPSQSPLLHLTDLTDRITKTSTL